MNRLLVLALLAGLPLAAHCPPRRHHRHRPVVVLEPAPWIQHRLHAPLRRPWCPPLPRVVVRIP